MTSLTNEYFRLTLDYQTKYGAKTILLMQVGAFFEMYGTKTDASIMFDVCELCQLNTSDKRICVGNGETIFMAGFRDYSLDKYVPRITDGGYTAVVYVQSKNDPKDRNLLAIYSPGTYISYETDSSPQITNHVMCVWFDRVKNLRGGAKDTLVCGVAVANIFTGQSHMFEYETPYYINPTTFDELERCVTIFAPSELIVISPFDDATLNTILQYSGVKTEVIHRFGIDTSDKIQNCMKQKYISHILTTFFGEESYSACAEFGQSAIATQAFCYLMDFVQEHNPNLVRKISVPMFQNTSDRVVLANHTLKQLNMIADDTHSGKLSSVYSFLNKCQTPMGKRLIHQQMTAPTFNEIWLNREYTMTQVLLDNYHFVDLFRKQLTSVKDLDKIARQLVVRKIFPASIFHLYNSIDILKQLNICLFENPDLCEYFGAKYVYLENLCTGLTEFIHSQVDVELCRSAQSMSFEHNIIKRGVSDRLDALIDKQANSIVIFDGIQQYFNKLMGDDFVKKHEPEKSCVTLQLTKKRAGVLKSRIGSGKDVVICGSKFNTSDVTFVGSGSANIDKISFHLLDSVTADMFRLKDDISKVVGEVYCEFLENLELNWFENIEKISKYIANMDVLQSKAYIARTYNYCRPTIDASSKSHARAYGIRHCLIEHIQTNELYVTNDIHIGCDEQDGMLLYGTNAVGKTSLIRALGISVVLAQCGMYVPCSRFVYKPYTAIYSRILGNDNLFKGLSTFAVEMSELRVILKMADQNSLILGDEICSGTETESALSIFVSALIDLTKRGSSFIFATHFHEIVKYDEVKQLKSMVLCHMAVTYDRERDCLIYDRKLAAGPGDRMYGLEVCKSLYLEDAFLAQAYSIRNKYFPENRGELSNKSTTYNGKKVRGICEMCKSEIAEETHHMSPQKDASSEGHIGTFHKNHKANLLAVCEKCHDLIHATETVLVRKKTTKGYILK